MSESLRDQLLKSGLARKFKSEPQTKSAKPQRAGPDRAKRDYPRHENAQAKREQSEIDLAKAYALRDSTERAERERAQREAEQRAREKKERKQRLQTLLDGKAQNVKDADIPRHFPHTNKIRRIYVTEEQLPRLNGGELGVVQFAGRYLLVASDIAKAAHEIDADTVVLLCDPQQPTGEDDVPGDLIW